MTKNSNITNSGVVSPSRLESLEFWLTCATGDVKNILETLHNKVTFVSIS